MAAIGQIYRDTYFDGKREEYTHRTIRIREVAGDKILAEAITDVSGKLLAKPRKTRLALKTLRSGYVLVEGA